MPTTTTAQVVTKLKATFARYGVADEVVSDNGPQFSSEEFKELARKLDFTHITSSPHHPQGNGHAERAVQIAKRILRQKDSLLARMCYRSTPCSSTGVSPAELLMGRKIGTTLPTLNRNPQPRWPNKQSIAAKDASEKRKQTHYYNQRHGVRNLPTLRACPHQSGPSKVLGHSSCGEWREHQAEILPCGDGAGREFQQCQSYCAL